MKPEPKARTQEQKEWSSANMERETRPYETAQAFLKRTGCKTLQQ